MRQALFKLHLSVLLAGFTGVFGKLIAGLSEGMLVWWRLGLALVMLVPYLALTGGPGWLGGRRQWAVFAVGGLQGLHWVLFYASIRASNVSVALVCISLMGFFSALFSPFILRTRWSGREFLYSGLTIVGIALIFSFDVQYRLGITIGVVSSAVATLFVIYTKKINHYLPPARLFFHEMLGAFLIMTVAMPLYSRWFPSASWRPVGIEILWIVLLAGVCTDYLYIIQLQALKVVSAFTLNLSLNLEPVYSVILAAVFLGEAREYTPAFYAGMGLIIAAVALESYAAWRMRRRGRSEGSALP